MGRGARGKKSTGRQRGVTTMWPASHTDDRPAPRIRKASDPVTVAHPVMLIVGVQPGIGRTTLGYSLDTLLLDFDHGSYRAANPGRDTLQIESWTDIEALTRADLAPYAALTVDTLQQALCVLARAITDKPDINDLTPREWGLLRGRFGRWLARLRGWEKDLVLLAHAKEERVGELRRLRADIPGGSYAEVLRQADFIGYYFLRGRDRVLDFEPSDARFAKNPARWPERIVPPAAQATTLLQDLFAEGRAALERRGDRRHAAVDALATWRADLQACTTPAHFDAALVRVRAIPPESPLRLQVQQLFKDRARVAGVRYDKPRGAFVQDASGPSVASPPAVVRTAWQQPDLGFGGRTW